MGNTNSNSSSSTFLPRWSMPGQDSAAKQIQITTDRPHGFYYAGEFITGTIEIPIAHIQQQLHTKNNRKIIEYIRQQSTGSNILVELVGDATYSAEVDVAADSDGHATHQVNVCRQRCFVIINQDLDDLSIQNDNQLETAFDQPTDIQDLPITLPTAIKGTFKLHVPDSLPPSLINNRPPSVAYTLELNLSSSRYRYQIPIQINCKGCIPHPASNIELNSRITSQHDICLQACASKTFYQPGEQISVRINYSNPQQRPIRSISVTLLQFYRIHHDEHRLQLDGKEWIFDTSTMIPQLEWSGETLLQLPGQPLQASFSNQFVGTTQRIGCELDYRIFIELFEKKGADIHLTLPSIHVTYQT